MNIDEPGRGKVLYLQWHTFYFIFASYLIQILLLPKSQEKGNETLLRILN